MDLTDRPSFWSVQVGEVKKLAPNSLADIAKEIATDADKFTISFPQDLKASIALLCEGEGGDSSRSMVWDGLFVSFSLPTSRLISRR